MNTNKNNFTLLELLVALGVFSIMILIMMDFFTQTQTASRLVESLTRVHENARVIFSTIENDFNQALATDDFNNEIPFAIIRNNKYGPLPCMVTQAADTAKACSRLAEVSYDIDVPTIGKKMKDADGNDVKYFRRSVTPDHLSSGGINSNWDFYRTPAGADIAWTKSKSPFYPVTPGVLDIRFNFRGIKISNINYEKSVTGKKVKTEYKILSAPQSYHYLPRVVDVELTLYDPITEGADNPTKTKKTFFKRFFIKHGPRNF